MDDQFFRALPRRSHGKFNTPRKIGEPTCGSSSPLLSRAATLGMLTLCLSLVGCVERRMTIRTNVDDQGGALVVVDNQEVGHTPVSTGFTYYADRQVRLHKDGYETVTLVQPIPAPWWDSLLVEFFIENLWPFTVRDEREFRYQLPPLVNVTTQELLDRAQQLRTEGQLGAEVVPAGKPGSGSNDASCGCIYP